MSISVPYAARYTGLALVASVAVAMPAVAASSQAPQLKTPVAAKLAKKLNQRYGMPAKTQQLFKVVSPGSGDVFLVVATDKKLLEHVTEGTLRKSTYVRKMDAKGGGVYVHTTPLFNAYDKFWTSHPEKYWWTAVRVDCAAAKGTDDCALEGEIRAFEVTDPTQG